MKQANFFGLFLAIPLLLASCSGGGTPTASSEPSSSETQTSSITRESNTASEPKKYVFYNVNDFHGAIREGHDSYGHYESGASKYFGELATRKKEDPEHTILLSSGDMWQGSLESNNSKGLFVTDIMSASGFDAMAVGNHEFDFGVENIETNANSASFPFLGGNIMNYENGETTSIRNSLFDISKVIEKDDIKIGIVGMIGEGQTTSITSKYVSSLSFIDPVPLALKESARLKEEEGTDINVLLVHCDESAIEIGFESCKAPGEHLSDYFDVVFCAHSHSYNNRVIDGVPLLQAYCNGQAYSKATITIAQHEVTAREGAIEYAVSANRTDVDVEGVVSKYMTPELIELGASHAGTVTYPFNKRDVGALGCKAIFDEYAELYPNLACAMMNSQRDGLSGEVSYSDIFKATPFANSIVIANIKGSDIIAEAKYNPTYTRDVEAFGTLDPNSFYTCAVIDYLFYHMNVNKEFDYFKGNRPGGGNEVIKEYVTYPYELIFEHFKNAPQNTLNVVDYRGTENGFDLYQNL